MTASAQVNQDPEQLEGVGIKEHLNVQVPLDLPFTDENNQSVTLASTSSRAGRSSSP